MKLVFFCCLLLPAGLRAQQPKSETAQAFDCYVQSAEVRMDARKEFVLPDTGLKVRTIEANGPNPHKLPGGQLYDWIGTVFIPGTTVERLIAHAAGL